MPLDAAADFASQAHYLFDLYTGPNGREKIEALVTSRASETEWLEFKSGETREEDLKHRWSKALSSFANNAGGVVIWGIYAARDPQTGVDAVQKVQLVANRLQLANRLKELVPPATDPPIQGVQVHPVPASHPDSTEGFVVCLIPGSDSRPHRSEFSKLDEKGGCKRFYIRIGAGTAECGISLLRQLFYPVTKPHLVGKLEVVRLPLEMHDSSTRETLPTSVNFVLRNAGRRSVDDLYVNIRRGFSDIFLISPDGGRQRLPPLHRLTDGLPTGLSRLHPGLSYNLPIELPPGEILNDQKDWTVRVFAKDMAAQQAQFDHVKLMVEPFVQEVRFLEARGDD